MFKVRCLLLMSAIFETSSSWLLPSTQFVEAFATKFQTAGVRIALPENKSHTLSILALMKHLRCAKIAITCNSLQI